MVQHHISDYQKRPFQKQVTAESIKKKKVMFSLKNDKATSTDGYTPLFFRHT